ncbi:hypothetical protein BDZ94DRAFT_1318699 [Collybia nuda]|uniref:Uncharacterized protein n=1 Tax=Collybia nuda TaxID=64659 RepID=A0A9P5YE87_9AGAR|nr:hypothetical protein BDZ94DRAFT_1318699 [Collybia nuda]
MSPEVYTLELSVSRINRLMRPLRNRCNALMHFTESKRPINRATYSSHPRRSNGFADTEPPPLAILQPPGKIHARTHFSKNGTERLEMSKRVYAVRDSFRDIVAKTVPGHGEPGTSGDRVITLSAMCSMVIGANLRPEADELEGDGDVDGTDFVNELYEAVPLEYRRWMVLSHALNLVQEANVRDPTLFTILYDVATSHGLFSESSAFLRSLLSIAFSSTTNSTSPIAHPAHTTFLLDLRTRWIDGGLPDSTFLSIVTHVLASIQDISLWTCKAVKKFAYNFCNANIALFMQFLTLFFTIASGADGFKRSEYLPKDFHVTQLHVQLYKWVKLVFSQLLSVPNLAAVIHPTAEVSDAILEFLKTCLNSGLIFTGGHRGDDDTSLKDLQGAIVSFATHWLSGPFSLAYSSDLALVVNRLGVVTPQTSTYNTLVQALFTGLDLHNGQQALSHIAGVLKSHNLLRLEASMWPCALCYIEIPENERHFIAIYSANSFSQYRHQLIENVEDAERRCFGQSAHSLALTPTSTRKHPINTQSGGNAMNRRWRWEPMVGVWIHGSAHQSSTKKKRTEGNYWLRSTRSRYFSSHGRAKTMLKQTSSAMTRLHQVPNKGLFDSMEKHIKPVSSSHSLSQETRYSRHQSWDVPDNPGWDGEIDDLLLECPPLHRESTGDSRRTPLARRPSNFASLVADAVTGRTELHRTSHLADVSHDPYNGTDIPECQGLSSLSAVASTSHAIYLPSDDSLDLFAYNQTSPIAYC